MSEKIVKETELTICLFGLPAKDAAVFRRVIDFSARKGRNYQLLDTIAEAQLVIMNDNEQQCAQAKQQGASCCWLLVGNGRSDISDDCATIYSIKRPLLVTRVMRELDVIADAIMTKALTVKAETETEVHVETQADLIPKQAEPKLESKPKSAKPIAKPERAKVDDVAQQVIAEKAVPKLEPKGDKPVQTVSAEASQHTKPIATDEVKPKPAAPSVQKETVEVAKPEITHRYNALVVDDSFAIRKQLELELRDAKIGADFAEDGEICLEKTAQNHYDLIFLDIMMPGIDGYEVCRRLRTQDAWKKTPIIMLSGKSSPLDEVQGVLAGCSTYLTKPVKSADFQKVLKRVTQWIDHFSDGSDESDSDQQRPRSGQTVSYS